MAQHAQLRIDTDLVVYFCDPHSPWQRGTNENTNGLLRQYFPKGTHLGAHGPDDLAAVAAARPAAPNGLNNSSFRARLQATAISDAAIGVRVLPRA